MRKLWYDPILTSLFLFPYHPRTLDMTYLFADINEKTICIIRFLLFLFAFVVKPVPPSF
jgi:hypothetical protein